MKKKIVPFPDLSPMRKAWYLCWKKPSYTKEEVLDINKEFLKKLDERILKEEKERKLRKQNC